MPEDMGGNKTVEEFVIELVTNFEDKLKHDITLFSSYQQKMGNISRSIATGFNNLNNQINANLSSMSSGSRKSIESNTQILQASMKVVQQRGNTINQIYENNLDNVISMHKKAMGIMNTSMQSSADLKKQLGDLPTTFAAGAGGEHVRAQAAKTREDLEGQLGGIAQHTEAVTTVLNNEITKAMRDTGVKLNRELGILAKEAAENLFNSVTTSAKAMDKATEGALKNVKKLQSQTGLKSGVSKIIHQQPGIVGLEDQLKSSQKQLKEQGKRLIDTEKMVQDARCALIHQTDDKVYESNLKMFQSAVGTLTKVREQYNKTAGSVVSFSNKVRDAKEVIESQAIAQKKGMKLEINKAKFESQYTKLIDNFKESFTLAGQGASDALNNSLEKGRNLKKTLNDNVIKLKALRDEAKALKSTGLVDTDNEVKAIDKLLTKFSAFKQEFKTLQSETKNAPVFGSEVQGNLKKSIVDIDSFSQHVKYLYAEMNKNADSEFPIGPTGVVRAKTYFDRLSSMSESFSVKQKNLTEKIKDAHLKAQKIRKEAVLVTNKEIQASMLEFAHRIELSAKQYQKRLGKVSVPDLDALQSRFENGARRIVKSISKQMQNIKYPKELFSKIDADYERIRETADKIGRTTFVSKKSVVEFESSVNIMKAKIEEYKISIGKIRKNLNDLVMLNKKGLGGPTAAANIEKMKRSLISYSAKLTEVERMSIQSSKKIESAHRRSSRSIVGVGLAMIRDLRWQYAAVAYIAQRVFTVVKTIYINTMNEIQKFRTDAMSLSASISYSLVDNSMRAFRRAQDFARDLMGKLEMQAAQTILTLEDMIMLTKTFAQAGIIPKTDEDVARIATVGTAIKILTEGMANAGVQMKQELNALIMGRQRATDQVAMMFALMGKDIKAILKEAEKDGKTLLDVLSKELEPFARLNKIMSEEYSVQINKLDIIFKKLKRIAGEKTLLSTAQTVKMITESIANFNAEGNFESLTDQGEAVVVWISAALETLRIIGVAIYQVFSSLFGALNAALEVLAAPIAVLGSIFGGIMSNIFGIDNKLTEVDKKFSGILLLVKAIVLPVMSLAIGFDVIATTATAVFKTLSSTIKFIAAGYIMLTGQFKKGMELKRQAEKEWSDAGGKVWSDLATRVDDSVKTMNEGFANIGGVLNKKDADEDPLGLDDFLPKIGSITKELATLKKKLRTTREEAAIGTVKFDIEFSNDREPYIELEEKVRKNIKELQDKIKIAKGLGIDEESIKTMMKMVDGHKEGLRLIDQFTKQLEQKRQNKRNKWFADEEKRLQKVKYQYNVLLESIKPTPQTKLQLVDKKFEKDSEKITNFLEKYKKEIGDIDLDVKKLWDSLEEGHERNIAEVFEDVQKKFDAFALGLESHDIQSVFQEINTEMDKQIIKLDKIEDGNDKQYAAGRLVINNAKKRRREEALITEQLKIQIQLFENLNTQADILSKAYSPLDRQFAEVSRLTNVYNKSMTEMQDSLDKYTELHQGSVGKWEEGWEEVGNAHVKSVEEAMELTSKLYQKDLDEVQSPYWTKLTELSKSWGEEFSGIISDAILGTQDFTQSVADMANNISKQILDLAINELVMNPVIDIFTNKRGEGEGQSRGGWMGALFDGGEKGGFGDISGPVPVVVVSGMENATKNIQDATIGGSVEMINTIDSNLKDTNDTIDKNMKDTNTEMKGSFSKILGTLGDGISGVLNSIGSMFGIGGSSGSGISSMFGMVAGMFGGASTTMSANTAAAATSIGSGISSGGTTGMIAMAGGGVIDEPIVGRGLNTGRSYSFGERESELVTPFSKLGNKSTSVTVPINISGIDADPSMISDLRDEIEQTVVRVIREHV